MFRRYNMDTKELQRLQAEYDRKYWEHNGSELEKIRHITLHVGKLLGKLSTFCEQREHGIDYDDTQLKREVTPDLQVYAAQLANLFGIDLEESYVNRQKGTAGKIKKYKK